MPPAKRWRWDDLLGFAGPYLGLVLVLVLFAFSTWRIGKLDTFLSLSNAKLIAVHAAIPAAVAIGMTVLMISGGIDLSVGNVVSLITVVVALFYKAYDNSTSWLIGPIGIALGLGAGLLLGILNGLLITRLQIVPFIVTLGTMGIARGLAQYLSEGSRVTYTAEYPLLDSLASIDPHPKWVILAWSAWSVIFLAIAVSLILRHTTLGRLCYAIGSNEDAAKLCGVGVQRTKLSLYALAGLLTGWGGVLMLSRSGAGSHDAAYGLELEVIAAVVIGGCSLKGGEGKISGSIAGALLITVLSNGCGKLRVGMETRFVLIGAIIIVISALNAWRARRAVLAR